HTCDTERHVDQAQTPRASERIADDDRDLGARHRGDGLLHLASAAVAVERQQRHHVITPEVGAVNSRVRADEALACLHDEHALLAHDAHAFVEHYLLPPWISRMTRRQSMRAS